MPENDASLTGAPIHSESGRQSEVGNLNLIYRIEGPQQEVPIFELARTLEALGTVIQEADKVVFHDRNSIAVRVKPFEEGSFVVDLQLSIQNNPTVLFFLTHPEAFTRIKTVLEYLGLIKKGKEVFASVLDVLQFLRNGKPKKVERVAPEVLEYHNEQGQVISVNQPIHKLINNGTIQQFIFPAVAAPLQRENVEAVKTFLAGREKETGVQVPRSKMRAIKAFSEPSPEPPREEVLENLTTEFLNPKAGTYGDTDGTWTFTKAGSKKNPFRARITDEDFLTRYGSGAIRFYQDDVLKATVKSVQQLKNGKSRTTQDIVKVLDYNAARPRDIGGEGE